MRKLRNRGELRTPVLTTCTPLIHISLLQHPGYTKETWWTKTMLTKFHTPTTSMLVLQANADREPASLLKSILRRVLDAYSIEESRRMLTNVMLYCHKSLHTRILPTHQLQGPTAFPPDSRRVLQKIGRSGQEEPHSMFHHGGDIDESTSLS